MVSQIVEEFQAKKAKSKLNQVRILVTGSSGFIGSAIFNNLKSDFQVTGLSRKSEAGLKMDLFKEQIDLSDFEYVIHAAGLAHLKQTDKDAMHQNNVASEGSGKLTELLVKEGDQVSKGQVIAN